MKTHAYMWPDKKVGICNLYELINMQNNNNKTIQRIFEMVDSLFFVSNCKISSLLRKRVGLWACDQMDWIRIEQGILLVSRLIRWIKSFLQNAYGQYKYILFYFILFWLMSWLKRIKKRDRRRLVWGGGDQMESINHASMYASNGMVARRMSSICFNQMTTNNRLSFQR